VIGTDGLLANPLLLVHTRDMGEVEDGAALKPPGRAPPTSSEPSDRFPTCMLVVLHTPSRKGLGAKLEIQPPRFTIGTARDDFAVDGALESGTHAEVVWAGDGETTSQEKWAFRGIGRVSINDEPVVDHLLRSGDQLRVVDTYFRFLPGSAPPESYPEAIYHITILHIPSGAHNHRYLTEAFARDRQRAARRGWELSLGLLSVEGIGVHGQVDEGLLSPLVRRLRRASDQWLTAHTGRSELVVVAASPAATLDAELVEQIRSCPLGDAQVRLGVVPDAAGTSLEQLLDTARTNMLPLSG
jgi:hypothetical protein